ATVLSWPLPEHDVSTLLRMDRGIARVAAVPGANAALDVSGRAELTGDHPAIAQVDAQAVVRRILTQHLHSPRGHQGGGPPTVDGERPAAVEHVATMARYIAASFRDPISPSDVARTVHLAPTYAMGLFRRIVGTTVGGYLLRCRVAEAQR